MKKFLKILIVVLILFVTVTNAFSQDGVATKGPLSVNCGDILDNEFETGFERHDFNIDLNPGDSIQAYVVPVGDELNTGLYLYNPVSEKVLVVSDAKGQLTNDSKNYIFLQAEKNPKIISAKLSAHVQYAIGVINFTWRYGNHDPGGVGLYTLYIGCTLRDGKVINPGDNAPATQPSSGDNSVSFSGNGFPGLVPVDFSSAFKVSLNLKEPNEGEIPTTGNNVLGFKFKAKVNDKMNLSFARTSGNLNLGLVVLSSTNQVIYMAALVNTETMSAMFPLPDAGEYTIGLFRLDLLPPASPENTAFQIQASLNS